MDASEQKLHKLPGTFPIASGVSLDADTHGLDAQTRLNSSSAQPGIAKPTFTNVSRIPRDPELHARKLGPRPSSKPMKWLENSPSELSTPQVPPDGMFERKPFNDYTEELGHCFGGSQHKSLGQIKQEGLKHALSSPNGPEACRRGIKRWKAEKAAGKVVKPHSLKIRGNRVKQHLARVDDVARKLKDIEQEIEKGNREIHDADGAKETLFSPKLLRDEEPLNG